MSSPSEKKIAIGSIGVGFPGILAIVFITLKLCGVINWSWAWVLAPLWLGWAIVLAFLAVIFLGWSVLWLFWFRKNG
ncbi:MAG TPA: hypothetical protein VEH04_17050 [Verrucomicrobiae bacterium]|nr:hypothetical protein [Verrucomicrobiae bacterium]